MILMIFSTVRAPQEPALTVESFAIRQTGRSSIRAWPVTTPSAGRSPAGPLMDMALANIPSSTKDPSSTSSRTRSRAKSLPRAAFASWYRGAPPFSTVALSSLVRCWLTWPVSPARTLPGRDPALRGLPARRHVRPRHRRGRQGGDAGLRPALRPAALPRRRRGRGAVPVRRDHRERLVHHGDLHAPVRRRGAGQLDQPRLAGAVRAALAGSGAGR